MINCDKCDVSGIRSDKTWLIRWKCDIMKKSVGAEIDRELAKERVGSRLE